jgi:hypothetical protein
VFDVIESKVSLIDILVHVTTTGSGGGAESYVGTIEEVDVQRWWRVVERGVRGGLIVARCFLRTRAQEEGVLIHGMPGGILNVEYSVQAAREAANFI